MKVYRGSRPVLPDGRPAGGPAVVTVNGAPINPRWDLRNHSPDGFQWGYSGSGPAQLALAILADHLGDDERAIEFYQQFKRERIATIRENEWELTDAVISRWWADYASKNSD